MNIIFNNIYKIEKINKEHEFLSTNSFNYKVVLCTNYSIVQLKYNLNDSNYFINVFLKTSNESEINSCLSKINGSILIKKLHDILKEWCFLTLSKIHKKAIDLINIENYLVEPYEVKYLNDVKKYLPSIVASAIINNIPDGYIFYCERKYLDYSMIDFTNCNNDTLSIKFNSE
jgi:hypothetical protein